ncbi:uncharacterized protein LOC124265779 isoform X2 [Haliotis rubra]|uniref:uncharacterized protein LOC124265779 isoform X2 n=1 Tax=Haliotis rubra TaxID=36100 RepID=UPI001EE578F1|nr:uncharacterized protein LOC124265779 isoform X2 [Haliotis rubra]
MRPCIFRNLPFLVFQNEEEMIYGSQLLVRLGSVLIGFIILLGFSVFFKDPNTINNQPLEEIRKEISYIRGCLRISESSSNTQHMSTQGEEGVEADYSPAKASPSSTSAKASNSEAPRYHLRPRNPSPPVQAQCSVGNLYLKLLQDCRHFEQNTKKNGILARAVLAEKN